MDSDAIYEHVDNAYSYRAKNSVDPALIAKISAALGYNLRDTAGIIEGANIGEGCGNPLAIASLQEGDTVVDIGCGGGFDALQASRKVGPTGRVIGVDMSQDMIALAQRNATKMQANNVEFIHCKATKVPVTSASVDCIISNCVLNLVPDEDKEAAISEMYRIQKPGGRLAMSDFIALKPFTNEMKADSALRAGCVSGAVSEVWISNALSRAGFESVVLVNKNIDLSAYKSGEGAKSVTPCCSGADSCGMGKSQMISGREELDFDLHEWIASYNIYGRKPGPISAATVNKRLCSSESCC